MRRIAAPALAALLLLAMTMPGATASSKPVLRFGTAAGYPLAVVGSGWDPNRFLVFSVQSDTVALGIELRPNTQGAFTIGIEGMSMCSRPLFRARSAGNQSARLLGPPLGCPEPAVVESPRLHVVVGKKLSPHVVSIQQLGQPAVTLRLGDALRFGGPGAGMTFVPRADPRYLVPLQHSAATASSPQPVWPLLAVHLGTTTIDMSASCRASKPPCEVPDFMIRVTIIRPYIDT